MSKRVPNGERNPKPGSLIYLTGRRFGLLVVKHRHGSDKKGEATWFCECDCGRYSVVRSHCLRAGDTRSCGCLQKESTGNRARKHGLSTNPRYRLWISARFRAKKFDIPFDIEWTDIPNIPDTCPVLGIHLGGAKRRGFCPTSPSLDKIRPSKGYVKGNIRVISHRANQIKSDGTLDELILIGEDAKMLKERP